MKLINEYSIHNNSEKNYDKLKHINKNNICMNQPKQINKKITSDIDTHNFKT